MAPVTGADAIAALYVSTTRRHDDGTPLTSHVISNPIVEIADDRATARVRSRFLVVQATPTLDLRPIVAGRYDDRFERVDGRWRFSARHMEPRLAGDLRQHLTIELPRPDRSGS
jgi:hypothetical protein